MQDWRSNGTHGADIVLSLAASGCSREERTVFAACQSGLYRSRDAGRGWDAALPAAASGGMPPVTAVALSPIFTTDRFVVAAVPGGIVTSGDAGHSWRASVLPPPPPLVSSLVISPGLPHDGTVLAGTLEDGVVRSEDRGQTWSFANIGLLDHCVLALQASPEFARDGTVYAGTTAGAYVSTNYGRSWHETGTFADASTVTCLALSPNFSQNGILFSGTEETGLWRSHDRGGAWVNVTDGMNTISDLVVDQDASANHRLLVLTNDDLLLSEDDGETWRFWNSEFVVEHGTIRVLAPFGLSGAEPLLVGIPGCRVSEVAGMPSNR